MESLGKITAFLITMIIGFFVGLLGATVINSIAGLYQLQVITSLSFVQIYGFIVIISLLRYRHVNEDRDLDFEDLIKRSFIKQFGTAFLLLTSWGLSFLAYYIIK